MVFTYNDNTGCSANSNNATYNAAAADSSVRFRLAQINELRKAVEEWYSGNGVTAPTWNAVTTSTLVMRKTRNAHINELRTAINKIRLTTQRHDCTNHYMACGNGGGGFSCPTVIISCGCNGNCGCTCNSTYGCTCAANCYCNLVTSKYALLTAFAFSNTTGDLSSTGTRKGVIDQVKTNDIEELRLKIAYINDNATIESKVVYSNGLSF